MIFGISMFVLDSLHIVQISNPAWVWLTSFTGLCFISGCARDRASILAKATMPGSIAKAVAESIRPGGTNTEDYDLDTVVPK